MQENLEIEIKAMVKDLKDVEKRLRDMGGIFDGEEMQEDEYFTHPCRDFKKTDEALRVRRCENKLMLTYKGKRVDKETKTRVEVEVVVEGDIRGILISLGFSPIATVRKYRRKYRLDGMDISLDHVLEIGDFVEIEAHGNYNEGKERVLNLAKKLSLEKLERRSYLEMVVEKHGKI